ncbi:MAG: hypothetical protein JST92_04305 [Deltaproteobacteria bacterium]|nr:hypothetical protein [Deltaproteobacteria bacterium]
MNVALDQARALVGLRVTQVLRKLVSDKSYSRVVSWIIVGGGGAFISASVAALLLFMARDYSAQPRDLAQQGGALGWMTMVLTVGVGLRAYISLISAAQGRVFLEPRRFLLFAVSPRLVTAVNLIAQLLEPMWLVLYPPLVALAIGVRWLHGPPVVASLFAGLVLVATGAALFHFFGAVFAEIGARRSLRRPVLAVVALFVFGFLRFRAKLVLLGLTSVRAREALLELPTGWAAKLAFALGDLDVGAAGWELIKFAWLIAALVWAGHRLTLREARREPEVTRASGKEQRRSGWKLPFLSDEVSALFEKELKMLLRANWIQLLIMPALFAVVRMSPGGMGSMTDQPLLWGAVYAHLSVLAVLANTFGFDADGARGFFLWPVRGRSVIAAKNFVAWLVSFAVLLAMALAVAIGFSLTPMQLAVGVVAHLAIWPLVAGAGNVASLYFPAPMRNARTRRSPGGGATAMRLVVMALIVGAAWVPWQLAKLSHRPLLVFLLLELAGMSIVYGGVLSLSESLLEARRDKLLRALARDE